MIKIWRALLGIGLVFGATVGAQTVTPAPAAGPSHFTLVPLSEGAYAAIAKPGDRASVGNAGFVIGSDGVLVVDACRDAGFAINRLVGGITDLDAVYHTYFGGTHDDDPS